MAADKPPEQIMRANCSTCHGATGNGGASWVTGRTAPRINGMMRSRRIPDAVRNGRPPHMPAFPPQEISNSELSALQNYIRNLPGSYVPEPSNYQATVTISDKDPWYNPMQVEIGVGDTVKFVNVGKTYHPATQVEFVASGGADGSDSGLLGPDGTYYHTFNTPGKYLFLCKIHPYMRGEIYVAEAAVPPTYHVDDPQPLPAVPGTGEVWLEAQWQDYPGRDEDGVIQVIDTSTWQVSHMIPVGNNPHNIWFNRGGSEAVITNWFDVKMSRINADTKQFIADVPGVGAAPAHLTSDFEGNNFYVSIEGSHYIQRVDGSDYTVCDSTGGGMMGGGGMGGGGSNCQAFTSGYGPHGIWYGSDGSTNRILTANSMDNTATIYDPDTMTEVATVSVGLYPLGAGTNSTGTKGYVGNCLDGTVSVIDMVNNVKSADIYIGGCPVQTPVSPDNRYVAVPNGPYVTVIDTSTDSPVLQFWAGKGAHGTTYGPKADGSGYYAYISHKNENYMTVVDLANMTHAGDVPLQTTTTGNVSLYGASDTGGQGIAARPLSAPWQ